MIKIQTFKIAQWNYFISTNIEKGQLPIVILACYGAPDKPCGLGRADANPKLLLNDT